MCIRDRGGASRLLSSHTTVRTGHVYGGSVEQVKWQWHSRRERVIRVRGSSDRARQRTEPDYDSTAMVRAPTSTCSTRAHGSRPAHAVHDSPAGPTVSRGSSAADARSTDPVP